MFYLNDIGKYFIMIRLSFFKPCKWKILKKLIFKEINDLIIDLKSEENSISVRAANAISSLDDITQNPNVPSFVRTSLWQAVSVLESIRE